MRHHVSRNGRLTLAALALLGGLGVSPIASAEPAAAPALRSASEVVIRGKKTLEEAIRAAMPTQAAGSTPPLVVFVFDVTPNVTKRAGRIKSTVLKLADDPTFAREIRATPLGRAVGAAQKDPLRLPHDVDKAIEKETPAVNTMADLKKSLAPIREPAVAVYVCDWRFEDDSLVESLAADLAERKIVLSVVGTEAAFGRAWTDGFVDPTERARVTSGSPYYPGIGRSPFGKPAPEAPWHGGECAYPPMPYHYLEMFWMTEFQKPSKSLVPAGLSDFLKKRPGPDAPPEPGEEPGATPGMEDAPPAMDDAPPDDPEPPEDLGDRLGKGNPLDGLDDAMREKMRRYPIPSGFGPYGLMRLAAVTGGRYALYSWNPGGRARVTYDYARCNLFGPDLRSRERILPEIATDPLASAGMLTWHALLASGGLIDQTPPLDKDLKTPRSIDDVFGGSDFRFTWDTQADWRSMRKAIAKAIPVVAEARRRLDAAIAAAKEPEGEAARRRLADAHLQAMTLRILEFELHECDLATRDVKPDLWKTLPKGKTPGVAPEDFIAGKANPLSELGGMSSTNRDTAALDPFAGEAITKARNEHIERYKGTPFGAQIDLADVSTFRVVEWEVGKPFHRGGMPSESNGGKGGPVTPPPGGSSSGGGGPTTGK